MTNRNFLGIDGQILENGDKDGATFFDRSLKANTVSAFLQTNIHVAKRLQRAAGHPLRVV